MGNEEEVHGSLVHSGLLLMLQGSMAKLLQQLVRFAAVRATYLCPLKHGSPRTTWSKSHPTCYAEASVNVATDAPSPDESTGYHRSSEPFSPQTPEQVEELQLSIPSDGLRRPSTRPPTTCINAMVVWARLPDDFASKGCKHRPRFEDREHKQRRMQSSTCD
jgi:hypothetical protein